MARSLVRPLIDRSARLNTERREIILDAARLVFDEQGLRGASLRGIAKAASCTTGAIYPYFNGKEEIYGELLRRSLLSLREFVLAIEQQPSDAEERFRRFAFYYLEHPTDFSLGLYLYDQGAPIGVGAELNAELNRLLQEIVRAVIFGDPDTSGVPEQEGLVFAALMGLLISHFTGRLSLFGAEFEPLCRQAFKALKLSGVIFQEE